MTQSSPDSSKKTRFFFACMIVTISSPVVRLKNQAGTTLEAWSPELSGRLRLICTGPLTCNSVSPEKSCTLTAATGLNSTLTYPWQREGGRAQENKCLEWSVHTSAKWSQFDIITDWIRFKGRCLEIRTASVKTSAACLLSFSLLPLDRATGKTIWSSFNFSHLDPTIDYKCGGK